MIIYVKQAFSKAASIGLWNVVLPIKAKDALYALKPDFNALNNIGGFHAFTLDTKEGIAESRNFCPLYGIDEEAATGISNGAFTYYLSNNHVLNVFNQEYIFRKATFILNMPFSI